MNERIKELAAQSDKWSAEEYHRLFLANEYPDRQKLFNEKFAELIVKECAEVAGCNGHVSGFTLGDLIQKHFGVE
jgi:hypothetical protein